MAGPGTILFAPQRGLAAADLLKGSQSVPTEPLYGRLSITVRLLGKMEFVLEFQVGLSYRKEGKNNDSLSEPECQAMMLVVTFIINTPWSKGGLCKF